jgi:hypothetical protein
VRRRTAVLTGTAAVVVVAVVVAVLFGVHSGTVKQRSRTVRRRHPAATSPAAASTAGELDPGIDGPGTFLGPDGVEATWVIDQNKLPGTTSWKLAPSPAGTIIEGFFNRTAAHSGQRVTLYVSTDAPSYQVDAYRMGYYQGTGARLVWKSKELTGVDQPPCPVTPGINMVACDNWSASLTVPITSAFVQGDYLFKLVGSQGQQSYVPLTVWQPSAHGAYLVKNDVLTWQAWNPFGGYDYYVGQGSCPADHYPLCSRARVVSFDRPYGYGEGAGDFLGNEYPLVRWMEKHGLDVAYATDIVVTEHPAFLLQQRTMLSLGHDECWDLRERDAAVAARKAGVNLVFFAASAILRHVRLQASPLGPDREEVDYRNSSKDPLDGTGNPLEVTGNTWSSPPTDWPESPFVGESYGGFLEPNAPPAAFVVADASSWVFAGTGLQNGSALPGVLRSDFDELGPPGTFPSNVQVLAHSPIPLSSVQTNQATAHGDAFSDMTYYTDSASDAGVLDSGTNNWIPMLSACPVTQAGCSTGMVRHITGNILHLFGQGPAGRTEPSVPNATQFLVG